MMKTKNIPENELLYGWLEAKFFQLLLLTYICFSLTIILNMLRSGCFKSISGIIIMISITLHKLQNIMNVYMLIHQLKIAFNCYNTPMRQVLLT